MIVEAADDDSPELLPAVELIVVGEEQRQVAVDSECPGDQILVFERMQRQRKAAGPGEVGGPESRAENDGLAVDLGLAGRHPTDRSIAHPDTEHPAVLFDADAARARQARKGRYGVGRIHPRIARHPDPANQIIRLDDGQAALHLRPRQQLDIDASDAAEFGQGAHEIPSLAAIGVHHPPDGTPPDILSAVRSDARVQFGRITDHVEDQRIRAVGFHIAG